MSNEKHINEKKYWNSIHKNHELSDIKFDNWLDQFSLLLDSSSLPIIDLGCGSGNDTLYLLNKKKNVIACDLSENAINNIKKNFPNISNSLCFDMTDGLPFKENGADVIIADLSLHYFKKKETLNLIKDIKRVLINNGHLIFRVNSINDINHGAGKGIEIEKNLYMTDDGRLKRFFDEESIKEFFKEFKIEYLKEETMNRFKLEKKLYVCCARNIK